MVSIIMPCFNSEKYIASAIESVIVQTYTDWELLITDDCSTDNTISIVDKYIQADRRIKLFQTSRNSGHPSEPRNISLNNALGEYLAFLDSDDMWLPGKLEEQIAFIKLNKCLLVSSYSEFVDSDGKSLGIISRFKKVAGYRDMLKGYQLSSPTIFCSASLKPILYFPELPKEDYIAWLKVLQTGVLIYNTQTVNAYYRVHDSSRSRNKCSMLMEQWSILRRVAALNMVVSFYYICIYIWCSLKKYYGGKLCNTNLGI